MAWGQLDLRYLGGSQRSVFDQRDYLGEPARKVGIEIRKSARGESGRPGKNAMDFRADIYFLGLFQSQQLRRRIIDPTENVQLVRADFPGQNCVGLFGVGIDDFAYL